MHPILFQIGGFTVYSYGFMLSLGLLVATLLLVREAPREKLNPDYVMEAIIAAAVAGLVGSRLAYVALNWSYYQGQWLKILYTREGGLTFYGAFIGGVLGLLVWCHLRKMSFFKMGDLMAPYLALGYAFGRVGCFLRGCCYGVPADVPWALPVSAFDDILRHPTQLYAALGGLLIFIILKLIRPVRPFIGFRLILLAALYGALRFVVEFFREGPVVWLNLTLAQLFSLGVIALCLAIMAVVFGTGTGKKKRVSSS